MKISPIVSPQNMTQFVFIKTNVCKWYMKIEKLHGTYYAFSDLANFIISALKSI